VTYGEKVLNLYRTLTLRYASDKWVSRVRRRTIAYRVVIHHGASRAESARTEARVDAFLVAAGFVASAISTYQAFWSTGWRGTSESGDTRANRLAIRHATMAVRSAKGWIARVHRNRICFQ